MLAAELFLANQNTSKNLDAYNIDPIKKIFMTGRIAVVDKTTREEFDGDTRPSTKFLQELLSMPLPTTPDNELNLPDKSTNPARVPTYVILTGKFEKQITQTVITISFKEFEAKLVLESNKPEQIGVITWKKNVIDDETCALSLGSASYRIGGRNLFEEYINSGIITRRHTRSSNAELSAEVFSRACDRFFNFVRTRWRDADPVPRYLKFNRFRIYLLPNRAARWNRTRLPRHRIEYVEEPSLSSQNNFKDMTGNDVSEYASKTTRNTKFLAFDDKSFTPNGFTGQRFYETVGIGKETLQGTSPGYVLNIALPQHKMFQHAGFSWIFMDMNNPDRVFQNHLDYPNSKGIFYQLYKNFRALDRVSRRIIADRAMMKVVCLKITTKTKTEILIDQNLTMENLRNIFRNVEPGNNGRGLFYRMPDELIGTEIKWTELEVLIHATGKTKHWSDYLRFVRSALLGHGFEYNYLLKVITKDVREKIFDWIKEVKPPRETKEFFRKSEICRKILRDRDSNRISMNDAEQVAYKIGMIAGHYAFVRNSVNKDKSFKDILTYAKYDREKLRHVFQRICRTTQFLPDDEPKVVELKKYIATNRPNEDAISDADKSIDYSYFFYSGHFTALGEAQ